MEAIENVSQLSDELLVDQIVRTKDSELFAELYDRYAPVVFNKCLGFAKSKAEAEDLTHDIFIKLFIKVNTFSGKSKFSTWLFSFTYNFCVNYIERNSYKKKEKVEENATINEKYTEEITDEDILGMKTQKLSKVLQIIEPKDKMILLLKYQDDLSIKDLCDVLEIGESAVKMRLKRAKEKAMEIYKRV